MEKGTRSHVSITSDSIENVLEVGTSKSTMDVDTLMDRMQVLLSTHSDTIMGRFKEHEDNLSSRSLIVGLAWLVFLFTKIYPNLKSVRETCLQEVLRQAQQAENCSG
ncbi:unnamed protein product [Lupinus luteus]|uniref:Uncharacterized protein n=1 Tax=Lupinus luteus TaxID=3873 RepID=A0AAV1Y3G6_LUPLU